MTAPRTVRLAPITNYNLKAVFGLHVAPGQERFVAPNPWSLAQALVAGDKAWPRAIVAGDDVVGFLMLGIDPADDRGRPYGLWRLMIGEPHQRRGYAKAALALAVDEVRRRAGRELYTSWVDAPGGPAEFYLRLGFEPTGELDEGEVVARLRL